MARPAKMTREQPELANNIVQPLAPLEVYHVSTQDHDRQVHGEQVHGEWDAGVQVLHHASRRRRRGGTGARDDVARVKSMANRSLRCTSPWRPDRGEQVIGLAY